MIKKGGIKSYLYEVATGEKRGPLPSVVTALLIPCSVLYWCGIFLRRLFYRRGFFKTSRLPVKVISVGNITLGGTGKTPFVEMLVRMLQEEGLKPAVLTRGYGGDEAPLLKRHLPDVPVLSGVHRVENARQELKKNGIDVFVIDDGFQYWAITPDVNIVLINSISPFGRGFLLPAGSLREPLSSLKRADVVALTRADAGRADISRITEKIRKSNTYASVLECAHRPLFFRELLTGESVELSSLEGEKAVVMSGIACPLGFEESLKGLGIELTEIFRYPDHYHYLTRDLREIVEAAGAAEAKIIITTEKDAVRMESFLKAHSSLRETREVRFLALAITLEVLKGEEKLRDIVFGR